MPRRRRTAAAGVVVAAALALSACGSDGPSAGPATAGGGSAPGAAKGASPLPAVDVVDVTSGETVALASLLPADKPTLVWMWAPH